ncbi:UvrD-helicase domain-containing protein [Anabaena sphaerica FACHB-251]|uniref:DNA 3'-5' helicase n=1 Tax=Anabaena sphaerica FACHB-251 TaxID=2692883 RepID=A0A927A326_9NOST|nr:UvrD-helicase domain-containing protein [Anabaena sphaerica]MBD2295175.1 UvrD-helicase domain-containing protein [Anabaena sphaerica FACHB-251]
MDSSSQIDTVKKFAEVIGDNDDLWEILLGREVIHIVRGKGRVSFLLKDDSSLNSTILEIGVSYPAWSQSAYNYVGNYTCRYEKNRFIREFNALEPPLSLELPLSLEKRLALIEQMEQENKKRCEAEKLEAQKREAERREAQRLETERRNAQKLEAQKREAERREAQRLEIERRNAQRLEAQKREAERREAQRLEIERRKAQKLSLLQNIKNELENNFLNADKFYQVNCTEYILFKEYQSEKLKYIQNWVNTNLNSSPDLEQAAAIGTLENHIQVIARAGSGKTSTLVNRAIFLQKHCGIAPGEMLLLAFNRKAAAEMRKRLTLQLQNSIPHVMTFHALAYALVHPENILFDEPDGEQNQSRALQLVIDDYLRHPGFYAKIRDLMMAAFREDWERIISGGYDKSPEEMLRYRRSLPREGIDGNYYKSFGEKLIADFLFEHNIKYKYERNFWWNGINYRPDFTILTGEKQGIVIEYFGLEGDPDYDDMSHEKREYWANRPNWQLIALSPRPLKEQGAEVFCALLKHKLERLGIQCNRLSEETIWSRIKDRSTDRFTTVMKGFIQRCRKLSLTLEELEKIIYKHECVSKIEEQFLYLAQKFYKSYLRCLEDRGEEDFDGLMQKAVEVVASGQTIFHRRLGTGDLKSLRYIMIDEYQDFSELFYNLIAAIRKQNPQALFFCVGDDWQAINGFAGSDLRFYQDFHQLFQPSHKLNIATNYRSVTSIVDIGNKLMQGLGTPARADKKIPGIVNIADMSSFEPTPTEQENYPGDNITPAILRLINKTIQEGKKVVLLSRKNSLPWYVNYQNKRSKYKNGTLDSFLELVRSYLPEESRKLVTISTAHKYKGLQEDVVIILDAIPRCYPLIHPDLMFTRVFGDSIERVVDEERRLFYVALTRAVETLFIVTESKNSSPFIEELNRKTKISVLNWSDYQTFIGVGTVRYITIKVGNQDGKGSNGTIAIKDLLKAEGYIWKPEVSPAWYRTYPAEGFSVQKYFNNANWISQAVGIEVRFCDDEENKSEVYHINQGQYYLVNENEE